MPPKANGKGEAHQGEAAESHEESARGIKLPFFSGDANAFSDFIFQLKAAFKLKGLGSVFRGDANEEDEDKAYNLIVTICSGPALQALKDLAEEKGSLAIKKLTEIYAPSSQDRQCSLQVALLDREFRADDTVDSFHDDIMGFRRDLMNIDKWAVIPDQIIRSLVITKISAVDKFTNVAITALADKIVTKGKSDDEVKGVFSAKLSELFAQLRVAESTANRMAEASSATAFAAVNTDHKGKSKHGSQHRVKKTFCTYCERPGHTADHCRTKAFVEKKLKEAKVRKQPALAASVSNANRSPLSLVVDTGASSSMVNSPAPFAELTPTRGTVTVASGETIRTTRS